MGFRDLDLKIRYRSNEDDIASDFLIPVLKEAKTYKRSVGFFSSSSLQELSVGIEALQKNGGHIQVICSPRLSNEDIEAIELGYEERDKVLENALAREKIEPVEEFETQRLNLVANLIVQGVIEFKLAFTLSKSNQAIYHEKIAVFEDEEGKRIAFEGSMNDSYNAFYENFESISVYTEDSAKEHLDAVIHDFDQLWKDDTQRVCVVDFPQVVIDKLKSYAKEDLEFTADYEQFIKDKSVIRKKKEGVVPEEVSLREYQKEAIRKWEEQSFRGIFDMATGTGKTFTGLGALCRLKETLNGVLAAVIVCPYTHLVEQWKEDLLVFGIEPIIAYGDPKYKNYESRLRQAVFRYNLETKKFFCLLTTKDTFCKDKVQKQLEKIKKNRLLIVDEVHNMGAATYRRYLDETFEYRLGLSATIDRHHDEEGTQSLFSYFGKKCIEYTLEMAIENGFLTHYRYYPIPVYLTEDELERYRELSEKIESGMVFDKNGKPKLTEYVKSLMISRARVVAGAQNKIPLLLEYMEKYKEDKHILVYCGSTKTEDTELQEECRQIDLITKCLAKKLHMKVARFTSGENRKERQVLIEKFTEGEEIQSLVAIKCLDEGVNIPAIKTAFILASTTNPKEYIQRRGRVLRLSPGKEYAEIYDFITLPRELEIVSFLNEKELKYDKSLIQRELQRIEDFRRLADNSYESMDEILAIRDAYQIYEEGEKDDE